MNSASALDFFLSKVEKLWSGKLALGWEHILSQNLLTGYGGVYRFNITHTATSDLFVNRIVFPFSLEYKAFPSFFLRAGAEVSQLFAYKSGLKEEFRFWKSSTDFSYSLGFGFRLGKFSCDFVIPSQPCIVHYEYDVLIKMGEVTDLSLWKIRAGFEF